MGVQEGGGGAGSFDWVGLGSQIHEDSLQSMQFFTDFFNTDWEKRQKEKELIESKRQFNESMRSKRRDQNLSGIEMLRQQRINADKESRLRRYVNALTR